MSFGFQTKLRLHFATPLAVIVAIQLAELVAIAATSRKTKMESRRRAQNALSFKIRMTLMLLLYPVRVNL
jgi:hypothetical protein